MAGCVAFYGRRYLARHEIPTDGFRVDASYTAGGRPNRITAIDIRVTPPHGLLHERRAAFDAVLSGCTLHHTLQQPPSVAITSDALAASRP